MEIEILRNIDRHQEESFISLYVSNNVYALEILSDFESSLVKIIENRHPARPRTQHHIIPGNIPWDELINLISSHTVNASQSTKTEIANNFIAAIDGLGCTIDYDHPLNLVDANHHVI